MTRLPALLRADLRRVVRDPMLALVVPLPLLLALLLRAGWPWLTTRLAGRLDLAAHRDFATGMALLLTPMLVGFVIGLMLLDEREEGVLAVLAVTPPGKRGWLRYRVLLPVLASVPMGLVTVWVAGLTVMPPSRLAPVVVLAALEAPLAALFMAAFAPNKVQGLALGKAGSAVIVAPLAALLVPPPWEWLAGLLPHYWVPKLMLARGAPAPAFALMALVALAVHGAPLWWMARRYERRVE